MREKAALIQILSLVTIALVGASLASSFNLSALPDPGRFETSVTNGAKNFLVHREARTSSLKEAPIAQSDLDNAQNVSDPSARLVMEMMGARRRIWGGVYTLVHQIWEARRCNTGLTRHLLDYPKWNPPDRNAGIREATHGPSDLGSGSLLEDTEPSVPEIVNLWRMQLHYVFAVNCAGNERSVQKDRPYAGTLGCERKGSDR